MLALKGLGRARTLLDGLWLWRQAACSPIQSTTVMQDQNNCSRNISTSCALYVKRQRLGKDRSLSEKKLTRFFVDHRRIFVVGGRGGKGSSCFHSEPRKEYGGPDGGDGGDGGHVILKVDLQVKSLASVQPLYRGIDGEGGGSKNCFGCNGAAMYIKVSLGLLFPCPADLQGSDLFLSFQVPPGTLVKEDGNIVADLSQPGDEYVAAFGGSGGKGNRFFLSNENRAPTTATPGLPGQERVLQLELKTMAHAGLVGFPNAGKSSLLRAISNAKPAVAAYPFTTLNPHVGIVQYQDHEQVAVADIPGIISGAHQNRGLGFAFLRHIERCRFLLYVLDLSTSQPWAQLQELKYELEQYDHGLSKRPHAIVGNKMDLPQSRVNLPLLRERVEEVVIPVSALTGQNVEQLILHLRDLYNGYVDKERAQTKTPMRW